MAISKIDTRWERPATTKTKLPPEGLYLGTGVYNHSGSFSHGGMAFTYWQPEGPTAPETVQFAVDTNQGNCLQFWQSGEMLINMAKDAISKGLFVMCIYSSASDELAAQLKDFGDRWLGYDFGERYSFGLYEKSISVERELTPEDFRKVTLPDMAASLMKQVHDHVEERHQKGWGNVMSTSSSFYLDYEIAAGAEIPVIEDFPFGNLMLSSAFSRGLYRLYDLPMWGSHLAHEWYSWVGHTNPHKMDLYLMALQMKYMSGSKMIINESGNYALQSSLCPDSPMHTMPRVLPEKKDGISIDITPEECQVLRAKLYEKGRKLFCNIDHRSPVATKYRKMTADFYEFVKENPAPKGQPEAPIAIAKGNYDFGPAHNQYQAFSGAICAAYKVAEVNPNWWIGPPEAGWGIIQKVFNPQPPVLAPDNNRLLSGTPYGIFDIVSFVNDEPTGEFLLKNYKALIFSGWNTCSEKQYKALCEFVRGGGRLCIALPHLSTDVTRNHSFFKLEDLVRGGDFSELCGLRVVGQGPRYYWATGNTTEENCLGLACPRRYGIMGCPLGELEFTGAKENYEFLAVDDEGWRPVIIRCKQGEGEVFFVNNWAYPGATNDDFGPGAVENSRGLMGELYAYIAKISRGHVWITGHDFKNPDSDCDYIVYTYFPDAGKICLLNIDYDFPRSCVLHHFGEKEFIDLAPGEFRILESVVLHQWEKINQE